MFHWRESSRWWKPSVFYLIYPSPVWADGSPAVLSFGAGSRPKDRGYSWGGRMKAAFGTIPTLLLRTDAMKASLIKNLGVSVREWGAVCCPDWRAKKNDDDDDFFKFYDGFILFTEQKGKKKTNNITTHFLSRHYQMQSVSPFPFPFSPSEFSPQIPLLPPIQ